MICTGFDIPIKQSFFIDHMTMPRQIQIAAHSGELVFSENGICSVQIGDSRFCLARMNEAIVAFQGKCPHAGADLSGGFIDKTDNVVCPLHHYRFSVATGRNVSGEGYFLKRYPVRVSEEGVFIELS